LELHKWVLSLQGFGIYQYTLEVKPEFKDQYSVTDLRTRTGVKRQLSGIKGVVEINTWGGYLKQYEIAITPSKLKAMNISTTDVLRRLRIIMVLLAVHISKK
jgi:cobalt-zinc-cadmium resistance protein CzcA